MDIATVEKMVSEFRWTNSVRSMFTAFKGNFNVVVLRRFYATKYVVYEQALSFLQQKKSGRDGWSS